MKLSWPDVSRPVNSLPPSSGGICSRGSRDSPFLVSSPPQWGGEDQGEVGCTRSCRSQGGNRFRTATHLSPALSPPKGGEGENLQPHTALDEDEVVTTMPAAAARPASPRRRHRL